MSVNPKFSALILIFGFFASVVTEEKVPNEPKDRYKFKFIDKNEHVDAFYQKCTGYCNKKYCTLDFSCRPVNRTSKLRKLDIYYHRTIDAPINLEVSTYQKFATRYRPLMLTTKVDLCEQLLRRTHPLFKFFGLSQSSNYTILDPCPLSGHRYLPPTYTNAWVGVLVPVGEWRIDFIISKTIDGIEEHIMTNTYYFLVKPTDATEF